MAKRSADTSNEASRRTALNTIGTCRLINQVKKLTSRFYVRSQQVVAIGVSPTSTPRTCSTFQLTIYARDDGYRGKIKKLGNGGAEQSFALDSEELMDFLLAHLPEENAFSTEHDSFGGPR